MNWEFWGEHYVLAFSAMFLAYGLAIIVIYRLPVRILRSVNICVHGWPPAHLDADGDWKPKPEKE